MNKKTAYRPTTYRLFSLALLLSLLCLNLGGTDIASVQALTAESAAQEDFTINTGMYQIPDDLLTTLKTKLGEISEASGGATAYGVGYYEEHSSWAWINLLVANGSLANEEEPGPSFLYFGVRNPGGWNVAYAENDQEYLSLLDTLPRDTLSSEEVQLLDGYSGLNQTKPGPMAPAGGLLFPWSSTQNSWRFSNGFHSSGFQSLGVESGAEAVDFLPPSTAQPARVLAMENGMVVNKAECTWNTVLVLRHDGYPDTKKFVYLHIQNGTSPVGIGTPVTRGQYLGELRTPVFNGVMSNGTCTTQGSGPFNCEKDINPSTGYSCSTSSGRHLHLGFGTDRNIVIDGNVVANLTMGGRYNSTNTGTTGTPPPPPAPLAKVTTGVFRPGNGALYLKNTNATGFADVQINYGLPGDYPVVGDWDGNGTTTIGIYRKGTFYLRNSNTKGVADLAFVFGSSGDQPIAGDWDGDGDDTIGVYRSSTGQFLLRNSNSAGSPEMSFYLGNRGDVGIAGDWDGDGLDTTGVFRPSNGMIFLKNKNSTGFAEISLNYGIPGDKPVMGDWDDDGIDTIGVYRGSSFYLRNSNTNGVANIVFTLGVPGDMPIAGNWDALP